MKILAIFIASACLLCLFAYPHEGYAAAPGPTVSILAPQTGSSVSKPSITVLIQAWDGDGFSATSPQANKDGVGFVNVTLTDDTANRPCGTNCKTYKYTWDLSGYTNDISHTIAFRLYDVGDLQGDSRTVSITVKAAKAGDGNLLARGPSNQICIDCHKVQTHSSQNTSAKYGSWEIVCYDCHAVHRTTNIFLVKRQNFSYGINGIANTFTNTVTFYNTTGDAANSYVNNAAPAGTGGILGVCQVCHTQTTGGGVARWRRTGNSESPSHYGASNSQRCISCHEHGKGFKASCDSCHGNPPVDNTLGGPTGLANVLGSTTGSTTAGKHAFHFTTKSYDCDLCHYNAVGAGVAHNNAMTVTLGFYQIFGLYNGGVYNGQAGVLYNSTDAGTSVNSGGLKQCSNLYCHGGTMAPNGATATAVWDGTAACGTCHGATSASPPTRISHPKHAGSGAGQLQLVCSTCHSAYTEATHVNGSLNWILNTSESKVGANAKYRNLQSGSASPVPSASYGTCSAVYCHSNVQNNGASSGPTAYATPTWGGAAACGSCHASSPTTGNHTKHLDNTIHGTYACENCHSGKGDETLEHADYEIDVIMNSFSGGTYGDPQGAPANSYSTCTNLYCHSIVQTATGGALTPNTSDYKNPAWGGAPLGCTGCHGNPPLSGSHSRHTTTYPYVCDTCHTGSAVTTHANKSINVVMSNGSYNGDATPGNGNFNTCSNTYCHSLGTSVSTGSIPANASPQWGSAGPLSCTSCHASPPNYTNGSPKANSHGKHSAHTCNKCHATVSDSTPSIISTSLHVNRLYNVVNATYFTSYTFAAAGGTCTSISCHFNGDAQWGATIACGACHANPPNTGKHLAHMDGTGAAYGNDSNNSVAATYRFNCGNCHPLDAVKHGNGTTEIELYDGSATGFKANNPSTAGISNSALTTVCSDVYCHSDGRAASARAFKNTPEWGGSFSGNKCAGCHGDPPMYANGGAGTASANSHYSASGFMGQAGGHLISQHFDNIYNGVSGSGLLPKSGAPGINAAHGDPATSTTISCNTCHLATVNWGIGIGALGNFSTYSGSGTIFYCGTCHTGVNLHAGIITDKSVHINASRDVSFMSGTYRSKAQLRDSSKPSAWTRNNGYKAGAGSHDSITFSGSYNSGAKSCTVSCHLNEPLQWGDNAGTTCFSCHTGL